MSDTISNTKDLDVGRTEALQSLLRSLGYSNDDHSPGAMLSTEQCQRLSEKIDEILGDGADGGLTLGRQPDQLLNEDGLPIIEISEHVNEDSQASALPSPSPFLDQDPTPFALLGPDEREWRRRERERILDLLEEEECLLQLQEERDAEEQRKEIIRKRQESAKAELDRLKAAQELQERMGKALVRRAMEVGEDSQKDSRVKPNITASSAKKSVSFADAPVVKVNERNQQTSTCQPGWGNVTPGRLLAQSRVPLVSAAETQKCPMRIHVVERCPTVTPTPPFYNDADSDDESASSTEKISSRFGGDFSDEQDRSSSSNNGLSDDEPLEEGFDYDAAQHHREISLEYHEKRHAIGAETTRVMAAHALNDFEQHETSNVQAPLSRFRANRMASAYDKSHSSASVSIGQSVIPASRQKPLRNSVRVGKLERDQLVGGDSGESGSEDETLKEVIQMLRAGNFQNIGPNLEPPPMSTISPPWNFDDAEPPSTGTITAGRRAKLSKFKLARGGTSDFQGDTSGDKTRSQPAVSSVIERKVPRSLPDQRFPINKPLMQSPAKFPEAPSMTVDTPSFPMTTRTPIVTTSSSPPHSTTSNPSSPYQMRHEFPPVVKSSAMQDSITHSRVSPRGPSTDERPISKFMTEKRRNES